MDNLNSDLELQDFEKRFVRYVESSEYEDIKYVAWECFIDVTRERLEELKYEDLIEGIFSSPYYDEYELLYQLGYSQEDRHKLLRKNIDQERLAELNWLKEQLDLILATGTFVIGSIRRENLSAQSPKLENVVGYITGPQDASIVSPDKTDPERSDFQNVRSVDQVLAGSHYSQEDQSPESSCIERLTADAETGNSGNMTKGKSCVDIDESGLPLCTAGNLGEDNVLTLLDNRNNMDCVMPVKSEMNYVSETTQNSAETGVKRKRKKKRERLKSLKISLGNCDSLKTGRAARKSKRSNLKFWCKRKLKIRMRKSQTKILNEDFRKVWAKFKLPMKCESDFIRKRTILRFDFKGKICKVMKWLKGNSVKWGVRGSLCGFKSEKEQKVSEGKLNYGKDIATCFSRGQVYHKSYGSPVRLKKGSSFYAGLKYEYKVPSPQKHFLFTLNRIARRSTRKKSRRYFVLIFCCIDKVYLKRVPKPPDRKVK